MTFKGSISRNQAYAVTLEVSSDASGFSVLQHGWVSTANPPLDTFLKTDFVSPSGTQTQAGTSPSDPSYIKLRIDVDLPDIGSAKLAVIQSNRVLAFERVTSDIRWVFILT